MATGTIKLTRTEPLFKTRTYSTTQSVGGSNTLSVTFTPDQIDGYKIIGLAGFDINQPLTLYRLLTYYDSDKIYIEVRNRASGSKSTTFTIDVLYMHL